MPNNDPVEHPGSDGLREYHAKRDFARTPEPTGEGDDGGGRLYCVQKHAATNLHYDFRLELDGVLKSWAVPRGPSLDPTTKPLAMQTEDHPLAYGGFEGVIPEGNYGAGTVMLWDTGEWEPIGDARAGLAKGDFKFRLHGAKLRGEWALVRMKTKDAPENAWLLLKKRDEHARGRSAYDVLAQLARSAKSGRTMAEIASARDAAWEPGTGLVGGGDAHGSGRAPVVASVAPLPAGLRNARRAAVPEVLYPQLATLTRVVPEGDGWLNETKLDGYRILAHIDTDGVRLRTRNGHDWVDRLPALARELARIPAPGTILDGELVALGANGAPDFGALQQAFGTAARDRLVYYVFDVPFAAGYDLRRAPIEERKAYLRTLLAAVSLDARVQYLDHIVGRGPVFYEQAVGAGFEGVVSKRAGSVYESRRSASWLKAKAVETGEFVVVGWSPGEGSRVGFGALLLGLHDAAGELVFQGSVGSGFSDGDLVAIRDRLDALACDARPLAAPLPTPADERAARWVKPEMVVEVRMAGRTSDGMVRHPVFVGVRDDVDAGELRVSEEASSGSPSVGTSPGGPREEGEALTSEQVSGTARGALTSEQVSGTKAGSVGASSVVRAVRGPGDALVAGVRVSNPDRFVYPEAAITKREVAEYYAAVAARMLPHTADRPLSIVRCPRGLAGEHFYQRHLGEGWPAAIKGVVIEDDPDGPSFVVHDAQGLVSLAQMGVLEIHPWTSRTDRPQRPDRLILDLDPGEGLGWAEVVAAAHFVRAYVEGLGLRTFVKTSGGAGVHVMIPITRRHTWDEAKVFTRAIAKELARLAPKNFVAQMTKALRKHKVYVDFLRNQMGATAVGPYSTRAREAATVSMPVTWDELRAETPPETFTVRTALARVGAAEVDPWAGFFEVRQSITGGMREAVGLE